MAIGWTTVGTMDAKVLYGLTTSLSDSAVDNVLSKTHLVIISDLLPSTTYFFAFKSGTSVDNNGGNYYTFTTTPIGAGVPFSVYGYACSADTTGSYRARAAVQLRRGSVTSLFLANLTDSSGLWSVNLGNLKNSSNGMPLNYVAGDTLIIDFLSESGMILKDTFLVGTTSPQYVGVVYFPGSCCIGVTGNVNKSAAEPPDLSDLSLLIAFLTITPRPALPCVQEANVNATGLTDLSDLSLLIAYLTVAPRPTLPTCP